MEKKENFKSGFVVIAGAPNAGKSTLLNKMLGMKIAITSRKPQTTRDRILGIVNRQNSQLVFMDTPGIHKAKATLNIRMVDAAISAMNDVDIVLLLIDASLPDVESEKILVKKLHKQKNPVVLALNKTDLLKKKEILSIVEQWSDIYPFKEVIPISAKHGTKVEKILETLEELLPHGPQLFPEDTITDLSERFIVAEMIREKIFRQTGQEIPYSIAVSVDTFKEKRNCTYIDATINVERDSQKGIIIGKGGSKLKTIGEDARQDIEKMLDRKVFLKLFVRVQKNWSTDTRALRNFGYDFTKGR
ncbi:MAG: GTPase Era [Desulfobacteraceae bacterium 4572_19]|nr:MAG: GTPase Era [Desulfobacteraceae bacterium 4572_19]